MALFKSICKNLLCVCALGDNYYRNTLNTKTLQFANLLHYLFMCERERKSVCVCVACGYIPANGISIAVVCSRLTWYFDTDQN